MVMIIKLLMSRSCNIVILIKKGPGTSFQSPALRQKLVRNVFDQFHFDSTQDSKEASVIVNSFMLQCL